MIAKDLKRDMLSLIEKSNDIAKETILLSLRRLAIRQQEKLDDLSNANLKDTYTYTIAFGRHQGIEMAIESIENMEL